MNAARVLAACLLFCSICSGVAAQTYHRQIPTIGTLKALGSGSGAVGFAHVDNYARSGDGGGGDFIWDAASTAAPNTCLVFPAAGVPTGRWVRQLPGSGLNVDMCGTGTADDSAAFTAALNLCHSLHVPLAFSARRYRLRSALSANPDCAFHGAGGVGGSGYSGLTILDWSGASGSITALTIAGAGALGTWSPGASIGGFEILGDDKHVVRGLYVSRVSFERAEDIAVRLIRGPGIFWGSTLQSSLNHILVDNAGTATQCEIEIDGEQRNGHGIGGTALYMTNINAEFQGENRKALAGLCVDRYYDVYLGGGASESAGYNMLIGAKPEDTFPVENLTITGYDFEGPANNADACVRVGDGWTGASGAGVYHLHLMGTNCANSHGDGFVLKNTSAFVSDAGTVSTKVNPAAFAYRFLGTNNRRALINPQAALPLNGGYIFNNGAAVPGAVPGVPWSMERDTPMTYATISRLCTSAYQGQRRFITDSSATTYNAAVAGAGSNALWVTCNGTHWVVGG